MTITVEDLQKRIPLKPQAILRAAKKILRHEKVKTADLSIVIVPDSRIKLLNKKYLNEVHPTDVLSFDFLSEERNPKQISGEVIISADTAVRNARIYHTSVHQEVLLYVVHGILHLLCYDDHDGEDIRKMRGKEEVLMKYINKT